MHFKKIELCAITLVIFLDSYSEHISVDLYEKS